MGGEIKGKDPRGGASFRIDERKEIGASKEDIDRTKKEK